MDRDLFGFANLQANGTPRADGDIAFDDASKEPAADMPLQLHEARNG
jgi:hypothetical protein